MLLLKTANKFDGLNPEAVIAKSTFHISKTVGNAAVRITFEDF